jgi:hypothetical protein
MAHQRDAVFHDDAILFRQRTIPALLDRKVNEH